MRNFYKIIKIMEIKKMNKLYLSVPTKDEMWFKKEMEADPKTMDYNAGYNVTYNGYNYEDGTIQEDLKDLQEIWFPKWVGHEPNKFFAYIRRKEDDAYIGHVFYKDETENGHEIGILIKGEFRGNGYATEAVKLLCQKADELGVDKLYHQIPDTRKAAIKSDLNNGFIIIKENIPCRFTKFGKQEREVLMIRTRK